MGDVCVRGRPGVGRNTLAHRGTASNRLALDIALYVCMRVCTCTANMHLHRYIGETRCSLMRRASVCAVATEFQSSPVYKSEWCSEPTLFSTTSPQSWHGGMKITLSLEPWALKLVYTASAAA